MYSVGDLVEVTRDESIATGRLASKQTDTAKPRWLVKFDESSWPSMELLETELGPILDRSDDNASQKEKQVRQKSSYELGTTLGGRGSPSKRSSSPMVSGKSENGKASPISTNSSDSKKKVEFIALQEESDMSGSKQRPGSLSREERSKRRQAMIEQDKLNWSKPVMSRPPKKKKAQRDEEVVRVPMLTGTLLLYRGAHRRAEFVRKF